MSVIACPICEGLIEIEIGEGGVVECLDCGELWMQTSDAPPESMYALDMEDERILEDEEGPRASQ